MQENNIGFQQLQGVYKGVVVKHLSKGKCKIWIPTIHPTEWNSYEKADLLPDAEQASSLVFGANHGHGIFSYPNIGSTVWCLFENGDQNQPVYFAAFLGGPEAIEQWDKARCMAGNHPDDAYVHHIEVKNSVIDIYETGFVKISTKDDANSNTCTISLDQDGNVIVDSSSSIILKSKQISIDAETQIDIKAPVVKSTANVQYNATSPAIDLDSSLGHTCIRSISNSTVF